MFSSLKSGETDLIIGSIEGNPQRIQELEAITIPYFELKTFIGVERSKLDRFKLRTGKTFQELQENGGDIPGVKLSDLDIPTDGHKLKLTSIKGEYN